MRKSARTALLAVVLTVIFVAPGSASVKKWGVAAFCGGWYGSHLTVLVDWWAPDVGEALRDECVSWFY